MGGGDKALQPLGSATLLDHVIARLRPQCALLALNANGDPARFARFGLPVLADPLPDHPGPLAGVLAGLDWAAGLGAEAIVTAAADTPFFPRDLAARLRQAARDEGKPIALAAAPDETGAPRRHPTFGLWPVALRDDLRRELAGGMRKIVLWASRHGAATALFEADAVDPFFNVNTPQDMARAQAPAGRRRPREGLRRHRLEELRQDDADGAARGRDHPARLPRLDREACAPRLRHRPAGPRQPPPPRGGRAGGAARRPAGAGR